MWQLKKKTAMYVVAELLGSTAEKRRKWVVEALPLVWNFLD